MATPIITTALSIFFFPFFFLLLSLSSRRPVWPRCYMRLCRTFSTDFPGGRSGGNNCARDRERSPSPIRRARKRISEVEPRAPGKRAKSGDLEMARVHAGRSGRSYLSHLAAHIRPNLPIPAHRLCLNTPMPRPRTPIHPHLSGVRETTDSEKSRSRSLENHLDNLCSEESLTIFSILTILSHLFFHFSSLFRLKTKQISPKQRNVDN